MIDEKTLKAFKEISKIFLVNEVDIGFSTKNTQLKI